MEFGYEKPVDHGTKSMIDGLLSGAAGAQWCSEGWQP